MNEELQLAIRERAYEHYLRRRDHLVGGDPIGDWLRAETEILTEIRQHFGKAKAHDETRARGVVDEHGHDLENPA